MQRHAAWLVTGAATLAVAASDVIAQPDGGAETSSSTAEAAHVEALAEQYTLPALTPVNLIIDATISSNIHQRGDSFGIHVAEDVRLNDVVVIPAGSSGEGQVVHAARSRAAGKPGELILAARFVVVDGREVRLRSFVAGYGEDRTDAGIATAVLAGPAAFLVRGGAFVIPIGTPARAKTAEDLQLPPH